MHIEISKEEFEKLSDPHDFLNKYYNSLNPWQKLVFKTKADVPYFFKIKWEGFKNLLKKHLFDCGK